MTMTFNPQEPSEYERLLHSDLLHSRQRQPSLTEEERAARRRASSRLAMEARRRAVSVLVTRHPDEYEELYQAEKGALQLSERYRLD